MAWRRNFSKNDYELVEVPKGWLFGNRRLNFFKNNPDMEYFKDMYHDHLSIGKFDHEKVVNGKTRYYFTNNDPSRTARRYYVDRSTIYYKRLLNQKGGEKRKSHKRNLSLRKKKTMKIRY